MLSAIIAFFGVIPGLSNVIGAVLGKMYDAKVAMYAARIGGDTNVAVATVKAAALTEQTRVDGLKVIAGSWILSFLTLGFALPYMLYEWQCVVYDKIWMHGLTKTDPLGGDLSAWATVIISCLFGSGTVLTAGHMYFNRKNQ